MRTKAYLGLGSNLGDRLAHLQAALDHLAALRGVRVLRSSRIYETDPVGGPPQPDYLNAVVEVETTLSSRQLLRACRTIEDGLGRLRAERWGPRTIDIDVLTFGRERSNDPELTLPHPRINERGFVLVPLLELEPDLSATVGSRLAAARLGPAAASSVRPVAPPLELRRPARRLPRIL